jgi:hypothetical protein
VSPIDEERGRDGRFLLLGSVSPGLMREVSESLAGRPSACELAPLLASELPARRLGDLWRMGRVVPADLERVEAVGRLIGADRVGAVSQRRRPVRSGTRLMPDLLALLRALDEDG